MPPAAPANDNFANRQTLSLSNVGATPVAGTIAGATAEGGEPSHGPVPAHHSAWYRWTPGAGQGGVVAVDTCHTQTQFDAAAAVYTGGAVSGLTPVKKRNQNCGNSTGARVVFNATVGTPTRSRSTGPTPARREPSGSRFIGYRRTTISRTASRSRPGTRA